MHLIGSSLTRKVRAHFQALSALPMPRFIVRVSLEAFAPPLAMAYLAELAGVSPQRKDLAHATLSQALAGVVIIAPMFETLLFQFLPMYVLDRLKKPAAVQVTVSVVLFAAVHFSVNWATGLFSGLYLGVYLAVAMLIWRVRRGWRIGIWVTFGLHVIHNLGAVLLGVILGELAIS